MNFDDDRDPNHGRCEFNDHGRRCGRAGTISLHILAGGPWYCSEHAFGLRGLPKKKRSGPQHVKEYAKHFCEVDDEARAEREAIQNEAR